MAEDMAAGDPTAEAVDSMAVEVVDSTGVEDTGKF